MRRYPTLDDVLAALQPLALISRPYGDNEGDPINSDTVLPFLSPDDQGYVFRAVETLYAYTRTPEGDVNRRAVNKLIAKGFPTTLNYAQYDQGRLVGRVTANAEWTVDISDAGPEEH